VNNEENEKVVVRALQGSGYHLTMALPSWPRRGDTAVFPDAGLCVRVDPCPEDGTTGFFVACFEKDAPDTTRQPELKRQKLDIRWVEAIL
jgi:16S rRNA C967 or C1407 C5-methylase (RsmB/RsmF family)